MVSLHLPRGDALWGSGESQQGTEVLGGVAGEHWGSGLERAGTVDPGSSALL